MTTSNTDSSQQHIAFIGGGNMASAIIGGLLKRGLPPSRIQVVEPFAEQRARLAQQFQVEVSETSGASLARADLVVWAVKPQTFREAAQQSRASTQRALHLSVAAGIRSSTIAGWLGSERVVRAMPNTPALVGQGMTALFARPAATAADRLAIERVVQTTGDYLWLDEEAQLDAATALSGSGPAYVFYFIEAMAQAGTDMGLSHAQARRLAIGTFTGASALAQQSSEPPEVLRARVTSKGGTTHAALTSMEQAGIKAQFIQAMQAARQRAGEMGDEFGAA
jgi:pyrroline-5-carboxylate reductase